jgi:hypothetical protein
VIVSKSDIKEYIDSIPAMPKVVESAIKYLEKEDIPSAAAIIRTHPPLVSFLQKKKKKPIFAQKDEIKDPLRVLSTLGIRNSKAILNTYLTSLLIKKRWSIFNITNDTYYELVATMIYYWDKILERYAHDMAFSLSSASPILCSSIIVANHIFDKSLLDVKTLKENTIIDYGTILKKLTSTSLIDISIEIAKRWEMNSSIIEILRISANHDETANDKVLSQMAKFLHLLFFYILSRPEYINAELNDLIIFDVDFVSDVYSEFISLIENE